MKIKYLLPLLLLCLSMTSCVEKITRIEKKEHMTTIPPEFSAEEETVKNRISAIIPAEKISFTSSKTTKTGEEDFHTLIVNIVPDSLPKNGISFYRMTDEIRNAVESGIANMGNYQKMIIQVSRTEVDNGVEHKRTYKKELDL